MIFQDPYGSLDPKMKVGRIVTEGLRAHNMCKSEADYKEAACRLLEMVGLNAEHATRYVHEFSGGQRQRIGIARALAVEPDLVVCDEPISALDVSIQAQIINLLAELQAERDLTYLFIAHDLSMVRHISHRVGVMYLGHLVEVADVAELFENKRHPYTQSLMSAAPVADPKKAAASKRILLEGDVPSPMNPPSGCPFRTRCRYATEECAAAMPPLRDIGNNHQVACYNML